MLIFSIFLGIRKCLTYFFEPTIIRFNLLITKDCFLGWPEIKRFTTRETDGLLFAKGSS